VQAAGSLRGRALAEPLAARVAGEAGALRAKFLVLARLVERGLVEVGHRKSVGARPSARSAVAGNLFQIENPG